MTLRRFATLLGAALIFFGALGFVPPLLTAGAEVHPLSIDTPHDLLFRLFPVSAMDNLFHILLGAWGLVAARSEVRALLFTRICAGFFAALTLLGIVPFIDAFPLYGNDILLHAAMTLVAAYFGWVHRTAPV